MTTPFSSVQVKPDWEEFVACIRRKGTPRRVHYIELFLDGEVQQAIGKRFNVWDGLDPADPAHVAKGQVRLQRFLGYDYVRQGLDDLYFPLKSSTSEDTASEMPRRGGRNYVSEGKGIVTNWEEFEAYPWPDPAKPSAILSLQWYEKNLPDDMCVIGSGGFGHFAELLTWLMGYETLCYALYDDRALVRAIADKLMEIYTVALQRILQFKRVRALWGSDDMGFKTGTLIAPDDLREFVLPGHKKMAEMTHAAGLPYILHSCGNLESIMEDLIEDVKIDARHSFEDAIEDVRDVKRRDGDRIALLGGIDVDFLCRADEQSIRERVRDTLKVCMPGGGYCLGTGNSVANYIPLNSYLAMLDEGRRFVA